MTQKIKNMKNKIVVLAYSGGLDTSYCLKKLSSDGYQVHAITINTGGFSNEEIRDTYKVIGQPLTIILNKDGEIIYREYGYIPINDL